MEKVITVVCALFIGFFVAAALGLFVAFPVMWLWNYAVVDVLHLPEITYWQAWALYWLCSLLFGSSSSSS